MVQSMFVFLALGCVCLVRHASASGTSECELYLAPSTIPNAGLGIFTSVSRERGEILGYPDVSIPIYDLHWNQGDDIFWPWQDYVWDGGSMGMHRSSELNQVEAFAPGLDCSINSNPALINVDKTSPQYDYELLPHRSEHPAAGSMTPFINGTTVVSVDSIPAGAELFKSYGDMWFLSRSEIFGNIPLGQDYIKAEYYTLKMKTFFETRWNLSKELQEDLLQLIVSMDSRFTNALPRTLEEIDMVAAADIQALHQPGAIRNDLHSLDDARCLDNIYANKSTIEGAGRGAFAARSIGKGGVITGSPVLHLPNASRFELYHFNNDTFLMDKNRVVGHQLVKNYCWGHPDTTLTLCPYGAGVNLINHSSKKSNVKIRWAPDGQIGQDASWFQWDPDSMNGDKSPHLAWDFVALRDIDKGEELFLDYGERWVRAWEDHVENWKPKDPDYKSAAEWNANTPVLRTIHEEPYPSNIELRCHHTLGDEARYFHKKDMPYEHLWDNAFEGIPCSVTNRTAGRRNNDNYTVRLADNRILRRVARKMFVFRDRHYSTDIHMEGVFRQEATLPDEMIPPLWRNIKRRKTGSYDGSEL